MNSNSKATHPPAGFWLTKVENGNKKTNVSFGELAYSTGAADQVKSVPCSSAATSELKACVLGSAVRGQWTPPPLSTQLYMYVYFLAGKILSFHPGFKGIHESLRAKKLSLLNGQ